MASRNWLMPAATGFAGLVAGFLIGDRAGEPQSTGVAGSPVVVYPGTASTAAQPSASPVTLDELRRVVREELAALPASGAPRSGGSDAVEIAPSPEQNLAADQARAVLGSALSRRSWTDADREALAPQFAAMSSAQRTDWLQQYALAVNQGRLVPDSELPPF